jgi:homoserine dehydrogenase
MSVVKVGLLGLGTVGTGVLKTLRSQERKLTERLGKRVEIVKVLVRDAEKERAVEVDKDRLTTRFADVLESGADIVVEVMGGVDPTYEYLRQVMERGCHVVTANKELLAKHGRELIELANRHRVHLAYEASVAGGIPILGVLRQFLRTNDITAVQGILNGTTNYILTQMEKFQRPYADVLREAQEKGYAEADPTSDVEGFDALYKLYILSQLVFGEALPLHSAEREGISRLTTGHIRFANELGYRVKLLAAAKRSAEGIRLSVKPTLIPDHHPFASIEEAYNAIQVTGNIVGDLFFSGKGAGELPTASAVVEDLAYLLTQPVCPQPAWREGLKVESGACPAAVEGSWFLFLESNRPEVTLDQLLQPLQGAGLQAIKLKTHYNCNEVARIGLIVCDTSAANLEQLTAQLPAEALILPVYSGQTEPAGGTLARLLAEPQYS